MKVLQQNNMMFLTALQSMEMHPYRLTSVLKRDLNDYPISLMC